MAYFTSMVPAFTLGWLKYILGCDRLYTRRLNNQHQLHEIISKASIKNQIYLSYNTRSYVCWTPHFLSVDFLFIRCRLLGKLQRTKLPVCHLNFQQLNRNIWKNIFFFPINEDSWQTLVSNFGSNEFAESYELNCSFSKGY